MAENLDHLDLPVWSLPGGAYVAGATKAEAIDLLMSAAGRALRRDLYAGADGYLPLGGVTVDHLREVRLVDLDADDETESGDPVLVRDGAGRVDLENLGVYVWHAQERAALAKRQRTPGTPEYRAAVEAAGQAPLFGEDGRG